VHHRHDDDESRNAERDTDQREAGDHRDKPIPTPGAQIAQCDHAFEGAKHHSTTLSVIPVLVTGIQSNKRRRTQPWIPGTSPGMTAVLVMAACPTTPSPCSSPRPR